MKNRNNRISGAGSYFHVYNRGNGKSDIFINEEDYKFFVSKLRQFLFPEYNDNPRVISLPAGSFSVVSYCLMPNHFHLLIRQNSDIPTSKLILKLCTSYSMFFNKKYGHVGHVFQDRFKQVHVDNNKYLVWLTAYIHQNPQIAKLVNDISKYKWSSIQDYLGEPCYIKCDKDIVLDQFKNRQDFLIDTNEIGKIISKNRIDHILLEDSA